MSSRARKPRRDSGGGGGGGGAGWLGALILGVGTAVAMGVGYLIGREEGREEREQRAAIEEEEAAAARSTASSSCSSSRNNLADSDDFPRLEPYAGAGGTASGSSPSHASPDDHLCKVCLEHPNDHVFLPCSHQSCCGGCASQLKTCPICRTPVKSIMKIYKS